MKTLFLLLLLSGLFGIGSYQAAAQDDSPPSVPEATETVTLEAAQPAEQPPIGFALQDRGVYLFTNGQAVPLSNAGVIRTGGRLPNNVPQTTNRLPSILAWSRSISPFQTGLASFTGTVDIEVEEEWSVVIVTRSNVADVPTGAVLWAVNGTPVRRSAEQAKWLLYGDTGSPVELTLLEGTVMRSVVVSRQPREREYHLLNRSFWDDRTILFTPAFPLSNGIYCLFTDSDWCFEVVSELDPHLQGITCAAEEGTVEVMSTRVRDMPSSRGAVILEIGRGEVVTALGVTENQGYLYVRLQDGTEGWVAKQTINLSNRFAQLPVVGDDGPDCPNELSADPLVEASEQAISILPAAANGHVVIRRITGAGDISTEAVEIQNNGPTVDLQGWTVSDAEGHVYTFGQQRLFSGGSVTLHTRAGTNTPVMLFWGLRNPIWQLNELAIMHDNQGIIQSTFRVID